MARVASMLVVSQTMDYQTAIIATGGRNSLAVSVCALGSTAASSSTTALVRVSDDQENWLWLKSDGSAVMSRSSASAVITFGAGAIGPATFVIRRDNAAGSFPCAIGWAFVQVIVVGGATPPSCCFSVDANMFSV